MEKPVTGLDITTAPYNLPVKSAFPAQLTSAVFLSIAIWSYTAVNSYLFLEVRIYFFAFVFLDVPVTCLFTVFSTFFNF